MTSVQVRVASAGGATLQHRGGASPGGEGWVRALGRTAQGVGVHFRDGLEADDPLQLRLVPVHITGKGAPEPVEANPALLPGLNLASISTEDRQTWLLSTAQAASGAADTRRGSSGQSPPSGLARSGAGVVPGKTVSLAS